MGRKKKLLKLVRDSIEKGATTAEDVHKAIAAMPLKLLKDINVLRGPAGKAGRIQDQTIGSIYDLIRRINDQVAKLASDLLADAAAVAESAPGAARLPAAAKAKKRAVVASARKPAASAAKRSSTTAKRSSTAAGKRTSRKKA